MRADRKQNVSGTRRDWFDGTWLLLALAAVVSSAACSGGDSATGNGVRLTVRTDVVVPDDMTAVTIAVLGFAPGLANFSAQHTFSFPTAADFPLSVGVGSDVPSSDWLLALPADYAWVMFQVRGILGSSVVAERWQVARLDGTLHEVTVDLQTACLGVPCWAGEECVDATCRAAPRPADWTFHCGDGVPDAPEECDEGDAVNSDLRRDVCRTDCHLPGCGDDVIDTGEQCDDGNAVSGDGCSATCQTEAGG